MPLVECKNGYAETYVGGTQYQFNRDKHGRYVAGIENPAHLHCFLAREDMYGVVPDTPEPNDPAQQQAGGDQRKGRGRKAKEDGKDGGDDTSAQGLTGGATSGGEGDPAQQQAGGDDTTGSAKDGDQGQKA